MSLLPEPPQTGRSLHLARAVFVSLLIVHLGFSLVGWSHGLLPGQEFRQTQTAISSLFIQRESNFALSYPTPILGKPWSAPMEFPLYQWAVVGVSNATKLPLAPSARVVSLACFYLIFPALLLLLRRLGVSPMHRWIAVSAILLGPIYVFYSRAFMIESMALMAAVWFLAAFVETMATQKVRWMFVATVGGVIASTVKITTFVPYVAAAALAAVFYLWQSWPKPGDPSAAWRPVRRVVVRAVGCVLPAAIAGWTWVKYSDYVKQQNVSADFLVSTALKGYNFGPWSMRFSSEYWQGITGHWAEGLAPLVVIFASLVVALIWGRAYRWLIVGCLALFLGVQLIFAQLYLIHIYYFYANGILLLLALGLTLAAVFHVLAPYRWARHLPWVALAAFSVTQYHAYRDRYLALQQLDTPGGGEHTKLLQEITAPDDVIVVVGDDWSSIIPYYAGRRALMIPVWREENAAYLDKAFAALRGSRVGAIIISKTSRSASRILDEAEHLLQILPRPTFTFRDDLVFYFHQDLQAQVAEKMHGPTAATYATLKVNPAIAEKSTRYTWKEITVAALADQSPFAAMTPMPEVLRTPLDKPMSTTVDNMRRLNAHAPSELVFPLTPGPHSLSAHYGMAEESYTATNGTATDGVDFLVLLRQPNRADRAIGEYSLVPHTRPEDRGTHSLTLKFDAPPGAQLILQTTPGPNSNTSFDWSYWGPMEIK